MAVLVVESSSRGSDSRCCFRGGGWAYLALSVEKVTIKLRVPTCLHYFTYLRYILSIY